MLGVQDRAWSEQLFFLSAEDLPVGTERREVFRQFFGKRQKTVQFDRVLNNPCPQGIFTGPAACQLYCLIEYIGGQFMTEQGQFRQRNGHTKLHLIGTHKPPVKPLNAHVMTQGHHEASAKGMAVDRANCRDGQRNDAAHESHEFVAEHHAIAALGVLVGRLHPIQIKPIGKELCVRGPRDQRRRSA